MRIRLLLLCLLFSTALSGQESIRETTFTRSYGTPGETGAMRITFDRHGAAIQRIHLLDHYETPEAKQSKTGSDDYYKIAGEVELVSEGPPMVLGWRMMVLNEVGQSRLYPKVNIEQDPWEAEALPDGVRFTIDTQEGLMLEKTFRKQRGRRDFLVEVKMTATEDRQDAGAEHRLALTGLALANPITDHVLGNPAVAIAVRVEPSGRRNSTVVHVSGSPLPGGSASLASTGDGAMLDFAGVTNRFFGAFLYADDNRSREALRVVEYELWPERRPLPAYSRFSVPVCRHLMWLQIPRKGGSTTVAMRQYLGPKSPRVFDEQPGEYGRFDAIMDSDLSPACFCDIPGARPMARFLLWWLRLFQGFVGNWGVAIVMLTLLVRTALVPLNFRMQKSMRAFGAKMARLKPQLDAINTKFANDPKGKQQAMIEFQRENKVFPPLGGCLPMLVTIPVFIGLFTALRVAYELRHEPFMMWVTDLSRPDGLYHLGWSWMPEFNLLPILMVALWFWLQSATPLPTDPQQRQVMRIMRWMPLLFGVMLYNYASGLMVYMITSSLYLLVEQRITKRILGPMPETGSAVPMAPQF